MISCTRLTRSSDSVLMTSSPLQATLALIFTQCTGSQPSASRLCLACIRQRLAMLVCVTQRMGEFVNMQMATTQNDVSGGKSWGARHTRHPGPPASHCLSALR